MCKIVNLDDMLDIAEADGSALMMSLYAACEASATALAEAIAQKFEIKTNGKGATFESGLGGLCAVFEPAHDAQECPKEIDDGDPGGDWLTESEEAELEAELDGMRENPWCGEPIEGASPADAPDPIRCTWDGPRCEACQRLAKKDD